MSRPWAGKVQLADDLGPQQRDDVREDREAEAREDLLGHGRAAEDVAPLEDERLHPGPGQVRGRDQPVVAAADDDRVVPLRHASPRSGAGTRAAYPACIDSMQSSGRAVAGLAVAARRLCRLPGGLQAHGPGCATLATFRSVPMTDRDALLHRTADIAADFLAGLAARPVRASATRDDLIAAFGGPLPEQGEPAGTSHR